MTISTNQLADEMARKCDRLWSISGNITVEDAIKESIPLLELLEVARAVKQSSKSQNADAALALYNLQKKVEL